MLKEKFKKLIPIICIVPFVLGTIGYIISGETVTDSMYASFALYFVNPVSDEYNVMIEISRWTAALVTTTTILFAVKTIWSNIVCRIKCLSKESVAVYCDTDIKIPFDQGIKDVYPGRNFKKAAKSHIIMLNSDTDSLKFYEDNRKWLKGKSVYIGLREIEYGLMKDNSEVVFYDINGSIARELWKIISVWKRKKNEIKIAIYGNNALAENILNYGLLLNLYSDKQRISYNLISNNRNYEIKHKGMSTGNGDHISFFSPDDNNIWDIIKFSDIVILSENISVDLMQMICASCTNGEIYYYSPTEGDIGDYLQISNIQPFGRDSDILTDENIRQGKLISKAKEVNLKYAEAFNGEKDWNKLNGFLKWSNISSADFNEVLEDLIELGINTDTDKLAELEHTRWCRFHYLNYWKYGIPENGKNKDTNKKIHICLKEYSQLREEDKAKDREVIETMRKNMVKKDHDV